jgi:hypothetical protein
MKIRIQVDDQAVLGTLDNTAVACEFAALLPMTLTLTDFAGIERIADLPKKLPTAEAPAGITPQAGDITYYAPWGNLAIFIANNAYAKGLVKLGRIDSGVAILERTPPLKVHISLY